MTKREALSLIDIAPRSELVEISDEVSLRVRGLSAETIKDLIVRFPDLGGVLIGAGIRRDSILAFGPTIIGALCAAATGEYGNEEAEKAAAELPIETQLDILEAMGRCTFSKGFGPFADRVAGIAAALSGPVGKAPDMSLPKESKPLEEPPIPPSGD